MLHEAKYLGKQVDYPQTYAPNMLVAVPRVLNREYYALDEKNLPFVGVDSWHAYELSFLTTRGLPVSGLLKLVYSATNPSLVESKSLKLYLNSFNMHTFGGTAQEGIEEVTTIITTDLSKLLETEVSVHFFSTETEAHDFDFENYLILENQKHVNELSFTHYTETPALLTTESHTTLIKVASHLLRSNCKITHQPDWGTAYIHLKGAKTPTLDGLLAYLISIRNENHFHEEICEMIYKRLWDAFQPDELAVTCIYTRRGGIDICPSRVSDINLLPKYLSNSQVLSKKLVRQ